jgi:hypothetical protein
VRGGAEKREVRGIADSRLSPRWSTLELHGLLLNCFTLAA